MCNCKKEITLKFATSLILYSIDTCGFDSKDVFQTMNDFTYLELPKSLYTQTLIQTIYYIISR